MLQTALRRGNGNWNEWADSKGQSLAEIHVLFGDSASECFSWKKIMRLRDGSSKRYRGHVLIIISDNTSELFSAYSRIMRSDFPVLATGY